MELTQYLPAEQVRPETKTGFVDVLVVVWIWVTLFLTRGPKHIQAKYHYVPQILLIILALPILVRRVSEGRLTLAREVVVYVIWGFWCASGLIVASNLDLFWSCYLRLWKYGVMFLLMTWAVDSPRRLRALILYGITGGMILAMVAPALGIARYELTELETAGGRETGALGNPNSLSHMAVLAFAGLMLAIATVRAKWLKIAAACLIPIPIYAAAKTGSRNAWVGLFTVLVMLYLFYLRPRLRGKAVAKLFSVAIILMVIVVTTHLLMTHSAFAHRYANIVKFVTTGQTEEIAGESRLATTVAGLRMTAAYPVFGVGLGQDAVHFRRFAGWEVNLIHSDFAGLGGVVGIPGLVLYYSILIGLALRIRRLSKHPLITTLEQKTLQFCLVFIASDLVRTLHAALYEVKLSWVIWGGFVGYASHLHAQLKSRENEAYWVESYPSESHQEPELPVSEDVNRGS